MNNTTIIEKIAVLPVRANLDKADNKEFFDGLKALHTVVYDVFKARKNGTATGEAESEAMAKVTAFLHTLGKCNGKYISVVEATKDKEQKPTTLFDMLVYGSYAFRIYCTSEKLATLLSEKESLSKKANEAHKALLDGKGKPEAYKL